MQLRMDFDGDHQNRNKEKNVKTTAPAIKKKNGTTDLADKHGLGQFVTGTNIDIHAAFHANYIDEIKGLFIFWVKDLANYKKARTQYMEEIKACVKVFQLSYFNNNDLLYIEKFCASVQKELSTSSYDNDRKNTLIKQKLQHGNHTLGATRHIIPEDQRNTIMISIYNSYIGSKKVTPEERIIRYNRLFFQHQVEYKKIYYPHGRVSHKNHIQENIAGILSTEKKE